MDDSVAEVLAVRCGDWLDVVQAVVCGKMFVSECTLSAKQELWAMLGRTRFPFATIVT